jgi:predicted CoA-substrate-specific enzyme activase
MNEICAAGTGAFLDEQAERLGIGVESFGEVALRSNNPASIAGRCAVFAKTDMIHQAQEGTPLPDILLGLAIALVRNYTATLIKGDTPEPVVSLQGGVMSNQAVAHAFREALQLKPEQVVVPPYFTVLGALGCAELATRRELLKPVSLGELRRLAELAMKTPPPRSFFQPLTRTKCEKQPEGLHKKLSTLETRPLIMGLDVGSVSVKGVIIDAAGVILREDYRLSQSRPLEAAKEVLDALLTDATVPEVIAVTGSGRYLAGRLLDADVIVNEITAQARAAACYDESVDTVVEIGGQDSKWIAFDSGRIADFEMNRVCAAGTGSFLMAQAQRLDLPMGQVFSDAAFASKAPADLGNRCTVFMESDLIHHQNNGASSQDLAAGVCISIVQNYLERVANHKKIGDKALFLGGVAATPAVKAAFEQHTGKEFHVPPFYRVSGAFGAALAARDKIELGELEPRPREAIRWDPEAVQRSLFQCNGCTNQCKVNKYKSEDRLIFHGGLCDRWESETPSRKAAPEPNLFSFRTERLEGLADYDASSETRWAVLRSPQYYEYLPFWRGFLHELGISLFVPPRPHRKQFESGAQYLRVETCLPMKVLAGQMHEVIESGVKSLFHPTVLSCPPIKDGEKPLVYCPYIQASSQFFLGVSDLEWIEPIINSEIDPQSFRREHIAFALSRGHSRWKAAAAFERGMEELDAFNAELRRKGEEFLDSLGDEDQAAVVIGKPYHTGEAFLNMNLGSLFQRLGIRALPGDLLAPLAAHSGPVTWKYQSQMICAAEKIARDPRLYPIFITFFGCGPDAFTLRHIRDALWPKPLLILEMDEHSSRAGVMTRIEAFWDRVRFDREKRTRGVKSGEAQKHFQETTPLKNTEQPVCPSKNGRRSFPQALFLPYMFDHTYALAAAATSVGVETHVLPPPDEESERLGRPHTVGGECHPYTILLGDYLKLAGSMRDEDAAKSRFYILSPDACRIGQFPVYVEKVRLQLGLPLGVVRDIHQGLKEFGISERSRQRIMLRVWEGLNAYDLLFRLFLQVRPRAANGSSVDLLYDDCRNKLYRALSTGRVREGLEEVLHELYVFPTVDDQPRPAIAVTGDYYTRVVPFANNDVYKEVEALGGSLWSPPTFSDCFKLSTMRDFAWSLLSGRSRAAARHGLFYTLMTLLELNVKASRTARQVLNGPLDLMGIGMWKTAANNAHTKLPAGITAPIATTLKELDAGADGILNLMTLNCSYGTVVTAALLRALKQGQRPPMLTLVYDGLKKTNEKTRIEAFMEQVHDRFRERVRQEREPATLPGILRRLIAR